MAGYGDSLDTPPDDWGGKSEPRNGTKGSDLKRGYVDLGPLSAEVAPAGDDGWRTGKQEEKTHIGRVNRHGKT